MNNEARSNGEIKPKKRGPGRPSEYTPERADAVCEAYADGLSIPEMDARKDLPCHKTWQRWALDHEDFAQRLARAREFRGDWAAEKGGSSLDISDAELVKLDKAASAAVQVRKSRSEYYRWLAGKYSPRYADRQVVDVNHGGQVMAVFGALAPQLPQAEVVDVLSPRERDGTDEDDEAPAEGEE